MTSTGGYLFLVDCRVGLLVSTMVRQGHFPPSICRIVDKAERRPATSLHRSLPSSSWGRRFVPPPPVRNVVAALLGGKRGCSFPPPIRQIVDGSGTTSHHTSPPLFLSSPRSCLLHRCRLFALLELLFARLSPLGTHVPSIGPSVAWRQRGGRGRNAGTVITVAALSPSFSWFGFASPSRCLLPIRSLPPATAVAALSGKLVSLPGHGG